jgi:hypothetical protein
MIKFLSDLRDNFKKIASRGYVLIFPTIFLSFLPLYSNRSWIDLKIKGSEVYPIVPYADSRMYLNQLKNVIMSNQNSTGYVASNNNDTVISTGSILHIWGTLGRLANLDVFQTYILMTILTGIVTFLCMYALVKLINKDAKTSLLITILTYSFILKDSIGRPSPTQLSLWLVFLLIFLIYKFSSTNKINIAILILFFYIILIVSNPFYALFISIYFTLIVTQRYKNITGPLISSYLATIFISLIYYLSIDRSKTTIEMHSRFGVLYDRFPGAFRLTFILLVFLLLVTILVIKSRNSTHIFILILSISSLLALNSQIFTGVFFEAESHFHYLIEILIFISVCYFILNNGYYRMKSLTLITVLATIVLWQIYSITTRDTIFIQYTNKEKQIISMLQDEKYSGSVFLIKGLNNFDFLDYAPLYTDIKLFWNPTKYSESITDNEILQRFSCTLESDYTFSDFLQDYRSLFAHKYLNEFERYPKWDWFRNITNGDKFITLRSKINQSKSQQYSRLIEYKNNNCLPKTFKYKVDYILNNQLKITEVGTNKP